MTAHVLPDGSRTSLAPTPTTRLAAEQLVEDLVRWGVERVFICPGSTEAAFLHAVSAREDLQVVLTTHESVAVSMADGCARLTGHPAVAYLHANVGLTNGLSHLYSAQQASSPVVVLTGLKQTQIQGRGGFTTSSHVRDFVRQYTKWDWQSLRGCDIAYDVSRALQVASQTPTAPTWVGLSQDLMESPASTTPRPPTGLSARAAVRPERDAVSQLADLLTGSERPVLVAGADVARSGSAALRSLARLAEATGLPVYSEDRRSFERTVLVGDHPQFVGMYDIARDSVAGADLVVLLGARSFVEFEAPTRSELPVDARVVHVHSDPEEIAKIAGVDLGVVADSGALLEDLLDCLGPSLAVDGQHLRGAREELHGARAAALATLPGSDQLGVGAALSVLAETFDAATVVVGDATTSGKALIHAVETTPAELHTTTSGSLGWGVGAAMGMQCQRPEVRVVAVLGDGAFQFGLQGLWTAARYQVPVTFVVLNNTAYAAVGAAIRRYAGEVSPRERDLVVELGGPHLADVSRGFGLTARRVHDAEGLREALAEVVVGPRLVEVMTDPLDLGP